MRAIKGIHIIIDLYGCNAEEINNASYLTSVILKAINESGLKALGTLSHKFNPIGYTSITLLSASHISIHTWPEHRYVALDIFACDEHDKALKAADIIISMLKPEKVERKILYRGFIYKEEEEKIIEK